MFTSSSRQRTRTTGMLARIGTAAILLSALHASSSAADDVATATAPTGRPDGTAAGTVVNGTAPAGEAGVAVDYAAYLPPGYQQSDESYATIYLLHGRGDTMDAWQRIAADLDELISDGTIDPLIAVMPDAPWSDRGNWYVDSAYTGDEAPAGAAVETALSSDLVAHIDQEYRTVADRDARAVGGYSMGGYGALRYALAHQDVFGAGMVLSPAVYVPQPPADSSARHYGAFGVGDALFDEDRYATLSYPALLPSIDPELTTHLFLAVGDDEWANPDPAEAEHDIDFETARIYNQVRRTGGITAELRILDGGHDWDVWRPAFREGIIDLDGYLRTVDPEPLAGDLYGTSGDDRAGGMVHTTDGPVVAINAADQIFGTTHSGRLDTVVLRRADDGTPAWATSVGTPANDRAYGMQPGPDGSVYVAGYTGGDLDGEHPGNARDDAYAARVSASGDVEWVTQFGDPDAADRIYATAPAPDGGLYVGGYTSGEAASPSAGDKDAVIARISPDGELVWTHQFGGSGEDKTLALAVDDAGTLHAGGVTSQSMPGGESSGGLDGWVAQFSVDGERQWTRQLGTAETDQVSALLTRSGGGVIAAGHTGGELASTSAGGTDAFVVELRPNGRTRWSVQAGSAGDDRAAGVVEMPDGRLVVAGHTDGAIGISAGGRDVFTYTLGTAGHAAKGRVSIEDSDQFGTAERDGADEWDEGNLYLTGDADGGVWVTGLTFGSTTGGSNNGAGDVFVSRLSSTDG
ncbi:alpha/beta hydrolase-fold protein [Phytoactinopolyspora halotolerans]|uniref:Esterase n=1 Tax=Phytoactinopolyspora halotolerans TaxID=1981512 RepID=A0A6L9S7K4_9ACTN|nr:alpha/beta hydrolase-fold protein [Phytoactinopolyspora halotolerans]NEE00963.1 esterase [Phytoactinopolyspora halotolerans]